MDYIANPVRVKAYEIITVYDEGEGRATLQLADGNRYLCDAAMTARHMPTIGDYLVVQDDGYTYINPKDVFERKYHPEGSKVSFAADREVATFLRNVQDKVISRGEKAEMAVVIYGTYGANFYVESICSGIEAIGVMEVGKATMMASIIQTAFTPEA